MAVTIPRAAVDFLSEEVNGISADAQARVLKVLRGIQWTPENIAQCRDLVIQALAAVMPTYTDMAAQASADFYDATREASVGQRLGATAMSGYDPAATDGAIRAFVQKVVDGKEIEVFNRLVLSRVDYELRRAANYCVTANGARDPLRPRYARVPTGAETCDFCLMLASRGFVYHSVSSAAVDHTHFSCDCRVIQGYPGDEVEDYDPQAIYDRWQDAVDAKAKERAERKGTTVSEERAAIMAAYGRAAKNAKRAGRKSA